MGQAVVNLPAGLHGRNRVVLDTMLWIYLFEDAPKYGALCEFLVAEAGRGRFGGIVTPVTVAELLVKPLEQKRESVADAYRNALLSLRGVALAPMTFETGCLAGALRAKYRLPLPDMIQAAFALQSGAPAMVTNDKAFRKIRELEVFLLDEML